MLRLGLSVAEKVLKIVIAAGKAADGDVSLDDASKLVDAGKTWFGLADEVTKREPAAARALKEALAGRIDGMLASPEHRDHAHDRASRYEQALERCMPEPKALRAALLDANFDAARAGREGAALMLARARDEVPAKLAPYLAEGQADAAFFAEVTGAALTLFFSDKAYFETLGRAVQGAVLQRLERMEGKLDWLVARMEQLGLGKPAAEAGVPHETLIALAQRVAADVEDADQALRELERAVEIAMRVREEGGHGSNLGALVDDVLQRLSGLTAAGRLDEASAAADAAIARQEREEAERREASHAALVKLVEAGLQQDLLRRDPAAAAVKVAKRVALDTREPLAQFRELMTAQIEWASRGYRLGVNLDLAGDCPEFRVRAGG